MSAAPGLSLARKTALASEILLAYAQVRWLLRHADLPSTLARLREVGPPARNGMGDTTTDERLARVVGRMLRGLPAGSRCLMQSLVLMRLLARRGRHARLVIGVSPAGEFSAHAWVERDGVPLLPPHEGQFGRLTEL